MSDASPMPCLAPECVSPLACNAKGQCIERVRTSAREYEEGLFALREAGFKGDPFKPKPKGGTNA